jgi:hypothetical protein
MLRPVEINLGETLEIGRFFSLYFIFYFNQIKANLELAFSWQKLNTISYNSYVTQETFIYLTVVIR